MQIPGSFSRPRAQAGRPPAAKAEGRPQKSSVPTGTWISPASWLRVRALSRPLTGAGGKYGRHSLHGRHHRRAEGAMLSHEHLLFPATASPSTRSRPKRRRSLFSAVQPRFRPAPHHELDHLQLGLPPVACPPLIWTRARHFQGGKVTKFFSVPTVYVRLLGLLRPGPAVGSPALLFLRRRLHGPGDRQTVEGADGDHHCRVLRHDRNHAHHLQPPVSQFHVVGSGGQPCYGVEVQIRDTVSRRDPRSRAGKGKYA